MQQRAGVEVVVVVAHHHVAPAHQLLAQVVRADLVVQRHGAQAVAGQRGPGRLGHRCRAGGRQVVVKAARQRAGRAVALPVGMLAGGLARCQVQHPQRQARCAALDGRQCGQRQRPARNLGREEKHLVDGLPRTGLEQRKQRAHGLADAGGRLRRQAAAGACGLEHRLGQAALAGAEVRVREAQRQQASIALAAVRGLRVGPVDVAGAQRLEILLQLASVASLCQRRCQQVAADVKVDQRQCQRRQAQLLAQQMAIDPRLRPVQCTVVGRHGSQIALEGLDLVEPPRRGVVAIGPAAHHQVAEAARQRQLGQVARRPARSHLQVAGDTLLRRGRRREAQVQVALLGRKLAQRAHGHRAGCGFKYG